MKHAAAERAQATPSPAATPPIARLTARISAYLADSIILLAFILAFFVIGGAVLLFSSDLGSNDAPDAAFSAFLAILLGGPLLSWSAFNLALMRWRGQSMGMYIIGIRAVAEGGAPLATRTVLLRWFGLHPLLFHPFLLPISALLAWALLAPYSITVTFSRVIFVITVALVLLCVVAPAASLLAMAIDSNRRALHDRLARTLVVHIDQP